jgi:hypothetical protein
MVGPPAGLLRIVADPGAGGPAVEHQDHGIHVEDQRGPRCGEGEQGGPQAVVQPRHLTDGFGRQAFQEAAQGGLIGETLQAEYVQEGAVVLQDLGLVDAPQAHDDCEQERQEEFGGMVLGAALRYAHIPLQQMAQPELVAKTLDQPHAPEVGQVGFLEGKTDLPSPSGHVTQTSPVGAFLSRVSIEAHYGFLRL